MSQRILILDGAMGHDVEAGDAEAKHRAYIAAGADIITTPTITANAIDLGDSEKALQVTRNAAATARRVADSNDRKIWVAGSVGPTGKPLTREHDASLEERMLQALTEQSVALLEEGVDIILLETQYDLRNTAVALKAYDDAREISGRNDVMLMVSATADKRGLLPMGQSLAEFMELVRKARPAAIGLNCGLGAKEMQWQIKMLAGSDLPLLVYPSAGIPDADGIYPDSPESFAADMRTLAENCPINIAGGCCGTTPRHIAALKKALSGVAPRHFSSSGVYLI